jgi:hypothetical protein
MRALLVRLDRWDVSFDPAKGELSFPVARRVSRIGKDDRVVFFRRLPEGGLRFEWVATVVESRRALGLQRTQLRDVRSLPDDRTLGLLAASLTIDRDPERVGGRIRHRCFLPLVDVRTLETGAHNVGRTVWFRILGALPVPWADHLGRAAWAAFESQQRARGEPTIDRPGDGVPVEQLLDLLDGYVVPTARLAGAIRRLEPPWPITIRTPRRDEARDVPPSDDLQGEPAGWSVDRLGEVAADALPGIERGIAVARRALAEWEPTPGAAWPDLRQVS